MRVPLSPRQGHPDTRWDSRSSLRSAEGQEPPPSSWRGRDKDPFNGQFDARASRARCHRNFSNICNDRRTNRQVHQLRTAYSCAIACRTSSRAARRAGKTAATTPARAAKTTNERSRPAGNDSCSNLVLSTPPEIRHFERGTRRQDRSQIHPGRGFVTDLEHGDVPIRLGVDRCSARLSAALLYPTSVAVAEPVIERPNNQVVSGGEAVNVRGTGCPPGSSVQVTFNDKTTVTIPVLPSR